MSGDRLEWIFDRSNFLTLQERYDAWSAVYDDDHDRWGWQGPAAAVGAMNVAGLGSDAVVLDAGCGTGLCGIALREAGFTGRAIGVDLSGGMLAEAAATKSYAALVQGSLYGLPLPDNSVHAVVSTGVFTHGHVDATALSELCRVTCPSGTVAITFRENIIGDFESEFVRLADQGFWTESSRSEPLQLHVGRDDKEHIRQHIVTWQVR